MAETVKVLVPEEDVAKRMLQRGSKNLENRSAKIMRESRCI